MLFNIGHSQICDLTLTGFYYFFYVISVSFIYCLENGKSLDLKRAL